MIYLRLFQHMLISPLCKQHSFAAYTVVIILYIYICATSCTRNKIMKNILVLLNIVILYNLIIKVLYNNIAVHKKIKNWDNYCFASCFIEVNYIIIILYKYLEIFSILSKIKERKKIILQDLFI